MKTWMMIALLCLGSWAQAHAELVSGRDAAEVKVVENLDLAKFAGTWFEIASIPQFFQRDCVATNATYTGLPDGTIDVLNKCHDKTFEGRERSIHGVAWAPDATTPAKLKVQFFWPLSAPYWVIDVGANYDYAVTASPKRNYLWILSRTRQMDPALYQSLLTKAAAQGFDVSQLKLTPQPGL